MYLVSQLPKPKTNLANVRFIGKTRADGERLVFVQNENIRATFNLPHIKRHSPEGFNWGYGGSGPADLALSILEYIAYHLLDEKRIIPLAKSRVTELAWYLHHDFKWKYVASWNKNDWTIGADEIYLWMQHRLAEIEHEEN